MGGSIDVILSRLYETQAFPGVPRRASCPPGGFRALVVDNGSRHGTPKIAAHMLRCRGVDVDDIAPIRVVRRTALLALGIIDPAFGHPLQLLVRAGAAGWRITDSTPSTAAVCVAAAAPGTRFADAVHALRHLAVRR